jgi:flagellar operon protein
VNNYHIGQKPFIQPTQPTPQTKPTKTTAGNLQRSFSDHFQQALQGTQVKFSHHAEVRLKQNGVELSTEQLERINQGVSKAKAKGAKESLMLMGDLAFVVSVKNETVITAMKKSAMEEQVVTNIDSAVLL